MQPTPLLVAWRTKAQEVEKQQVLGEVRCLEACYDVVDLVYAVNPQQGKIDPKCLGLLKSSLYTPNTIIQSKT